MILGNLAPKSASSLIPQITKRKVYFAFDFDDLMRVNNIRQAAKVGNERRIFYDRSIWERRNIREEKTLKSLMREAVTHSSTVCVLVGTDTWKSRWVKYEIARAVIDNRGLVAVHINSINHHARRKPDPVGFNPLNILGIYQSEGGKFYLYEKSVVANVATGALDLRWMPYEDYTDPVQIPRYLYSPAVGYVMPLARACDAHDYMNDAGYANIGGWIDAAARKVGR